MAGVNIRKFYGIAPKVSPELLPDTAGEIARNTKLYSGDLIPHPMSLVVGDSGRPANTLTLYGLRDPSSGVLSWLTWDTYVDVAVVTTEKGSEFRFFYTGDGPPKFSTFPLATYGAPPYPTLYYKLGLPLPVTVPTVSITPFVPPAVVDYARDLSGVVTINTSVPHNLKDRSAIIVSGFTALSGSYTQSSTSVVNYIPSHGLTGTAQVPMKYIAGSAISGTYTALISDVDHFNTTLAAGTGSSTGAAQLDMISFNATGVICTVLDSNTFTYPAFGFAATPNTILSPNIQITLGGPDVPRTYVYTWINQWGEESIASEPSALVYVKESVIATVGNLPSGFTDPNYEVNGIALYRSAGSATSSDYLLLKNLWFPKSTISFVRSAGVATIGFSKQHEMIVGDRFRLEGMGDTSFDVPNGTVTGVPDENHIRYTSPGADTSFTILSSGILYYDVSEKLSDPPRYWGWGGNYNFIDDFSSLSLTEVLASDIYEQPPENLEGLITAQNGILAGFVKNTVYFSVPYKPNAWPSEYAVTLDYDVVALALLSGSVLVLTTGYPFLISGSDPAVLSTRRVDALYPCINRAGVVSMNYGVVYPTHEGLAVVSTQLSAQIVTKVVFESDTWHIKLDPKTIVAEYFGDAYVASWTDGSFTFDLTPGEQTPPYFVDYDPIFSAPWYDPITGHLFYAIATGSSIYEWDPLGGPPLVMNWKSKVFKTPDMINLGAARVIADYPDTALATTTWEDVNSDWRDLHVEWLTVAQSVEFTLWVDKKPIATVNVDNNGIFRLPSGYRTDTFEVAVSADIRIRAIHLAETPYALRQV